MRTRARAIRAAAVISYFLGVAAGLGNVAVLLYWQRRRELPVVFGIPLLGGGPFSPPDRIPLFGSALVVAHAADAVAGHWLWRSRRRQQLPIAVITVRRWVIGTGRASRFVRDCGLQVDHDANSVAVLAWGSAPQASPSPLYWSFTPPTVSLILALDMDTSR